MPKLPAKLRGKPVGSQSGGFADLALRLAFTLAAAALPVGILGVANDIVPAMAASVAALCASFGMGAFAYFSLLSSQNSTSSTELAFSQLVENMRDALIQFDQHGNVILSTQSSKKLLGCEGYELASDGLSGRVHILEQPLFLTAFAEAHKDGKSRIIEVRMRRDGAPSGISVPEYFWAEIFLSPNCNVPNSNANDPQGPFAVTATLRDVSESRRVKAQIDQARLAAEEASVAKNRFLAVIGHELRTPLNAIVGFSDMMANGIGGKLEPVHEEYVSLISQSGHHLLEMVNMLLDMSKIEAGGFELHAEYFEPEKLVAPCVKMVTKPAAEKCVELDVKLGSHLPEIRADERACRQILLNLLSNAIKFSDAGGRVAWTMKQRGKSLVISVSDTGIGMNEAVLARLGEPFFQAQNSVDRRYEGTGLGVSIVKGLVDLHGGEMNVKSVTGAGTTVEVVLPINGPETIFDDDDAVTPLHDGDKHNKIQVQPNHKYKRTA